MSEATKPSSTAVDAGHSDATAHLPPGKPLAFEIRARDSATKARAGIVHTPHGDILTPVFMPVGTHATVKAVAPDDLAAMGASIVLSNTYHMLLRPGPELVARFGGLHGFMRWPHPILTDSGGFQVFSLGNLREVSDDGVRFRSHLDGTPVELTPERVMQIEALLGADIILPLDECPPFPCAPEVAIAATERTHRWAERALGAKLRPDQALFGIPQGSMDAELRAASARFIGKLPFDGFSIGGLSVGEPKPLMWHMLEVTIPELPDEKPRHLLGVGSPDDLLEGIERGVDMFDCVLPTRTARTGGLYTPAGRVNIRAARWREEQGPVDVTCDCYACRTFSAGYLHHLIRAEEDESRGELLYYRLASIHNLRFLIRLMEGARQALLDGTFPDYKASFMAGFTPPDRTVAAEQRRRRG
ncbi:MAG TPA: tRNA guanosine(34) transglycosylase Tgt [Ktedonobacterales bacterium]|jgi:queuine tRNA-ribosyltransferase|nr:tRNA guanosine(34) transglycosylase Tgt [Ktedonobacterales bacterium]